jgi:DNA repair protein RadD
MILREYQKNAVDAVWQHLCTTPGNPVIVAPTGSGKSLMIAAMCRQAVEQHCGRVIVLAHRKELLQQNAEKIRALLPDMDIGIYSAGLKQRDTEQSVIVAGIQSVYSKSELFGDRHLILIDECHLIPSSGEGMYRTILHEFQSRFPTCRLVGLTATPFRLESGPLCTPEGLLNTVCYDIAIAPLMTQGYLCRVVSKSSNLIKDFSKLHHKAGEFVGSEVEAMFCDQDIVGLACHELLDKTQQSRSCLVFCCSVRHAGLVAKGLQDSGQHSVEVVVGTTPSDDRADTLRRFRAGETKYLVNCNVLTTGYDAPNIDAIAVLRATESPGLFAQMVGRGMRIADGKTECLVLDFGGNLLRHGAIDHPKYGMHKKQPTDGTGGVPLKTCPNCFALIPIAVMMCDCGHIFESPQLPRHQARSDSTSPVLMADAKDHRKRWNVIEVTASHHRGREGKRDTMRLDYMCQIEDGSFLPLQRISEWICIEHDGYAQTKARKWWAERSAVPFPESVRDALNVWWSGGLAASSKIETEPDGKFLKIIKQTITEEDLSYAADRTAQLAECRRLSDDARTEELIDVPF